MYDCQLSSTIDTKGFKNLRPENIEDSNDILEYMKGISLASELQAQHVDAEVKNVYEGRNIPIVVMGDRNDVGSSYAITRIESCGLKDAWR